MSKTAKTTKRVSHLSKAAKSAIARKAANSAWRFMHSPAYRRIADSNKTDAQKRKLIDALKAARA
jgi:hypothetical protein